MLNNIGDAASGLGLGAEGLSRISIALGQIKAKGKFAGDEGLQLAEAGIPVWQMLADSIGVSTGEVMKLSEKGLIPADRAITTLVDGMGKKFPNMMQKQSKSFAGLMSTLKDNTQMTLGKVMQPAFDYMTKYTLPALIDKTNKFSEAFEKTGKISDGIKAAFGKDASKWFDDTGIGVSGLIKKFGELGTPLKGCVDELGKFLDKLAQTAGFKSFGEVMQTSFTDIIKAASIAVGALKDGLTGLQNGISSINKLLDGDFSAVKGTLQKRFLGINDDRPSYMEWYKTVPDLFGAEKAMNDLESGFKSIFGFAGGVNNFSGGTALVGEEGPEIVNLPKGSNVIPNPQTRRMLSNNSNVYSPNITINVNGASSPTQTAKSIKNILDDYFYELSLKTPLTVER
jgi:tape measure domain-containing protein